MYLSLNMNYIMKYLAYSTGYQAVSFQIIRRGGASEPCISYADGTGIGDAAVLRGAGGGRNRGKYV